MKKIRCILLTLFCFFLGVSIVDATCEASESNKLNSLAVNVKANYEVVQKEVPIDENFNYPDGLTDEEMNNYVPYRNYFNIYITNITEDLYVKVTNQNTNETKTYSYDDTTNGVVSFEEPVFVEITNYTITVYSSAKTNCPDSKLYTLYLTTPMYNSFSESNICEGIEDFYLCHEYLSVETSFENFYELTTKYREGKIDGNGDEINDSDGQNAFTRLITEHKGIVIAVAIVIVVGGIVTVIIVRKQRRKIV